MILLALGFAVTAGTVDAATYRFSFESGPLQYKPDQEIFESDWDEPFIGKKLFAVFEFSLPDLISRSISYYWDEWRCGSSQDEIKPLYCDNPSNYPYIASGWGFSPDDRSRRGYIWDKAEIVTNEKGELTKIRYDYGDDPLEISFGKDRVIGNLDNDWGAPGKRTVSKVSVAEIPAPAGGVLVLTAVAALGLAKRRRV